MDSTDYSMARPRRSGAGLAIALLVAFLLGIALTAAAVHNWSRLAELLHPAAASTPSAPVAPRVLVQPVAVPLPQAPDTALATRIDGIEARIDGIETRAAAASGDADRAEALLVAFAARRALDRGQPLGFLEGLMRDRFGASDAPAVALVIAAAQRPVTLAQLQDGLATLAPALSSAAADESWWTGFRREVGGLFVVRRAGVPSAVPADRIARATRALDQGQVDTAAAEVARLPGAARAGPWLAAARRYLMARNALDRIETAALLKPATPPVAPTP